MRIPTNRWSQHTSIVSPNPKVGDGWPFRNSRIAPGAADQPFAFAAWFRAKNSPAPCPFPNRMVARVFLRERPVNVGRLRYWELINLRSLTLVGPYPSLIGSSQEGNPAGADRARSLLIIARSGRFITPQKAQGRPKRRIEFPGSCPRGARPVRLRVRNPRFWPRLYLVTRKLVVAEPAVQPRQGRPRP